MVKLIADRLGEILTKPEDYGKRPLTFNQVSSLLWSCRLFFIEYPREFKEFEELIAEYLQLMLDDRKLLIPVHIN